MGMTSGLQPVAALAKESVRIEILDRRSKLQAAAGAVSDTYLSSLLAEIDAALERLNNGTYGICETCHDAIEAECLAHDPLVRFCLEHMSARELQAHEQDIALATKIQARLLPPADLALDSWEAHYGYHPAGAVGGDYCELIPRESDGSLFFAVGDVSGKGVAASLLMTHLNAIFRSLLSLDLCVDEVMTRANRLFCDNTSSGHYATLVCGRITGGQVQIANAGHCKPVLLRRDSCERLECSGLPLGLFCGVEYTTCTVELEPGDSLLLYSDGITESRDMQGNEFGEARLIESARRHFLGGAKAIMEGVRADLLQFRTSLPPVDDETLLVLRRR